MLQEYAAEALQNDPDVLAASKKAAVHDELNQVIKIPAKKGWSNRLWDMLTSAFWAVWSFVVFYIISLPIVAMRSLYQAVVKMFKYFGSLLTFSKASHLKVSKG